MSESKKLLVIQWAYIELLEDESTLSCPLEECFGVHIFFIIYYIRLNISKVIETYKLQCNHDHLSMLSLCSLFMESSLERKSCRLFLIMDYIMNERINLTDVMGFGPPLGALIYCCCCYLWYSDRMCGGGVLWLETAEKVAVCWGSAVVCCG